MNEIEDSEYECSRCKGVVKYSQRTGYGYIFLCDNCFAQYIVREGQWCEHTFASPYKSIKPLKEKK